MSVIREEGLGDVLTVIGDRPAKFSVIAMEMGADSHDPYREIRLIYRFSQLSVSQGQKGRDFLVRATDELSIVHFDAKVTRLHDEAVRFGLMSIRRNPDSREFKLDRRAWESIQQKPVLEGQNLRKEILGFYYRVNISWPDQPIGVLDLLDNFYNSESELEGWVRNLVDGGLLTKWRQNVSYIRPKISTRPYVLTPGKEEEVRKILEGSQAPALIDPAKHRHFKLVETHLEIQGKFALMLMPFDDKEFPGDIFYGTIEPVVRATLGIDCVRVDDVKLKEFLEGKIFSHIVKSEFVIAELSTENPNVILELGLAFGLEKTIITTFHRGHARRKRRLSFDYAHYDTIFYEDAETLRRELTETLRALKSKSAAKP